MNSWLTIIIPVYNAEKTISRCVDSILADHSFPFEVILINDGSQDHSAAICERYAENDRRVHFFNQENGGVSSARNLGLDHAAGKYIAFVDSDDYLPENYHKHVFAELQSGDWDLIQFSTAHDNGTTVTMHTAKAAAYQTRNDAFPRLIADICDKSLNSPCAKLYRRSIIERNHIRFPAGVSVAEDRAFNINYSLYVSRYRISEKTAYVINVENEQSLSRKRHSDLLKQFELEETYERSAVHRAGIPEREKEQYQRALNFGICRGIILDAKNLIRDHIGWFDRQKALWKCCKEINGQHLRYPNTAYCRIIALPVRLSQTWLIDLMAKRLLKQ